MMLALLGPDGSGKSTAIDNIRAHAAARAVPSEVIHFRVSFGGPSVNRPAVIAPYAKRAHPALVALAKVGVWHLAHAWWGLKRRRNAGLVIFDRSLYDIGADPRRYRIPAWVARLPWRLLMWPRPNLTVVLCPPTDVIQARKSEVSFAETDWQRRRYDDLMRGRSDVLHIREVLPPDEIAAIVIRRLGVE